jgi:signal transduction histidine kinase/ligand-binding sensor domain-containing protein
VSVWGRVAGVVVLLLASVALAQTPPGRWPFVEHAAETIGGYEVLALAQDTQGFLWIGTNDGLFRYDGSRIEPIEMGSTFASHRVERLLVTAEGDLWCVTPLEARRWRDGRWLPFPAHQPPGSIRAFAIDPGGRIWIATDAGLFQEQPGGGFQLVPGWPGGAAVALWIDTSGDVYVITQGVLYRRSVDGSWKSWGKDTGMPGDLLFLMGRDAEERLWVCGSFRLLTVSLRSGKVEEIPLHGGGNRWMRSIHPVPWGGVWITSSQGLLEYDGSGPARPVPGSPPWVNALLLDREGSLWTGGPGIHRVAGRGQWRTYTSREGLPNDMIFGIRRDPKGQLWVSTQGGLARSTAEGWRHVPGVPTRVFSSIVPDAEGHVWLGGTEPGAILRYALDTGELTRFPLEGGNGKEGVRALAFDREGTLWVATSGGLFRAQQAPARRFLRFPIPWSTSTTLLFNLLVDAEGRLWMSGRIGLAVLEQGQLRRFSMADGLRQESVHWLAAPRAGRLCVAYGLANGVDCFRYEQGRLENVLHLDKKTGLSSDNTAFLGADSRGRLWIGTGRGLDRLDPAGGMVHFGVADGMPGEDCDAHGFWEDPDGSVWIGTSKGLGHFRESPSAPPFVPLQVILTEVRAGEQRVPSLVGEPELPHERNTLEFDWAAPTFSSGKGVVRQVRLEGLEPDFREEEYRARYVGLPPGRYEFQARARRPHEAAWGPVTRFAFVIRPPWWQTWWFRVALATVVVGTLGALARWRQHALRARNAQLERLVEQRTRELTQAQEQLVRVEKQATERRMAGGFAHEMRNALTGAKLLLGGVYREDGRSLCVDNSETLRALFVSIRQHLPVEKRQEVAGLLKHVNGNEEQLDGVLRDVDQALGRALGTTNVLLDYARTTRAQPGSEPVRALALAESLVAEYREDFARHEIVVRLEVGAETVLRGSEAHFLSMLKNLWLNARDAVLEKPAGHRHIRLAIREQGQGHVLEVEDSGTGIAPEHREAIFEPFFSTKPRTGTGLGLSVVQRLTSLYGGTISVESTVGVGTRFSLLLPHTGAPASVEQVRDQLGQGDEGGLQGRRPSG